MDQDGVNLPRFSGLTRGAHEFAERRDVWSVSTNPCSVHRQSQAFGSFHINTRIIEFREAKPNGWKHSLGSTRVDRTRWPVSLPRPVCDCEELVPIVLVPHRSLPRLRALGRYRHKMRQLPLWSLPGVRPAQKRGTHRGQAFGIRPIQYAVQHRLGNVSVALRKRNYRVGIGLRTERAHLAVAICSRHEVKARCNTILDENCVLSLHFLAFPTRAADSHFAGQWFLTAVIIGGFDHAAADPGMSVGSAYLPWRKEASPQIKCRTSLLLSIITKSG
jgi:hypothetical protein